MLHSHYIKATVGTGKKSGDLTDVGAPFTGHVTLDFHKLTCHSAGRAVSKITTITRDRGTSMYQVLF